MTNVEAPRVAGAWSGTILPDDGEDDLVGTTLSGTYIIERVLGEGGMGRVYLARHTRIQRKRFAIKTLHPEYLRRPDLVARFQREAETAAAIQSEHVVGVYDVDTTPDGRPFLVAELLAGRELGDLLDERGKLPVAYAVRVVRQLCKALSVAHAEGVVHRDMKPENVFLTGDLSAPHAKVLDFGISHLEEGSGEAALTKTGMIMGTPTYMPPEQARGERVDHRADIYAVGVILYRALTGQPPFDRSEPSAIVLAVLTQEPARPRSHEPSIPDHLEAVIQRAMAKDPDERFQTMDELSDALALYDESPEVTLPATGRAAPGPRSAVQRGTLTDAAREVRDVRPHFVLLVLLSAFALIAGLFTAISGAVQLGRGSGLTGKELGVGLFAALASLSTPAVLWFLRLRRTAWDNSLRMLELVEAWRRPLFAAAGTYGLGWLAVAFLDHAVLERPGRWPGWDLWLFALALGAALGTAWLRAKRSSGRGDGAEVAGVLSSPVAAIPLGAAALFVVIVGAIALRAEPSAPVVAAGSDAPIEPDTTAAAAPTLAPDAELASAKASGVKALRALTKRYPGDPRVLRELVVAVGAKPSGLAAALDTVEMLHALAPKALLEAPVEEVVLQAARTSSELRGRALDILAQRMGTRGLDLLYELSRPGSAARSEASALLAREDVRERGSPALRILLDLEQASSCGAKAALLERVEADGDERCARILEPLTVGSSKGCGFLGLSSCPAKCGSDAGRMRKAIDTVKKRPAGKG